jgi:hypothetical protein
MSLSKPENLKECDGISIKLEPQFLVFVGPSKQGKTKAFEAIMYEYAKVGYFKFGLIISSSAIMNDEYMFWPRERIWEMDEWDQDRFDKYINVMRVYKKNHVDEHGKKFIPPNFIIFDDMLGLIGDHNSNKKFYNWISRFRHTNTTVGMLIQKFTGAMPLIRTQTDLAFMYRQEGKSDITGCYENYGQRLPQDAEGYENFKRLLFKATDEMYHCLVYKKGMKTPEETYCEWTVPIAPEFKMTIKQKEEQDDPQHVPQDKIVV